MVFLHHCCKNSTDWYMHFSIVALCIWVCSDEEPGGILSIFKRNLVSVLWAPRTTHKWNSNKYFLKSQNRTGNSILFWRIVWNPCCQQLPLPLLRNIFFYGLQGQIKGVANLSGWWRVRSSDTLAAKPNNREDFCLLFAAHFLDSFKKPLIKRDPGGKDTEPFLRLSS